MDNQTHFRKSSYREMLLEHLFTGELLKSLWVRGINEIEVLKPQVDDSGYDIVITCEGIVRYMQLKASFHEAKSSRQNLNLSLTKKPGGCIVWIRFDQNNLTLGPYLFFGAAPGLEFPDISDLKVAKHNKGDRDGVKKERPNIRVIPKGKFQSIDTIEDLARVLFNLT